MKSDIKLDGDFTVVEGSALMSRTWDIMLDAPDRRVNSDGLRRALVHSSNDELVINFAGDYPGGVTIAGKTNLDTIAASSKLEMIPPRVEQPTSQPSDLTMGESVSSPGSDLGLGQIDPALLVEDVFTAIERSQDRTTTELTAEIRRLRQAVLELNERLKRLENA